MERDFSTLNSLLDEREMAAIAYAATVASVELAKDACNKAYTRFTDVSGKVHDENARLAGDLK